MDPALTAMLARAVERSAAVPVHRMSSGAGPRRDDRRARACRSRCCSFAAPAASAIIPTNPSPRRTSPRRCAVGRRFLDELAGAADGMTSSIRGGTVVTAGWARSAPTSPIEDGRIAEIGAGAAGGARRRSTRAACIVLPGVIDVHVHFNEPGRTEWEGAATGSRALAAGGGTLFFDMPLNSTPCTRQRARVRPQARGARSGVDHRLRPLGRPRARVASARWRSMADRGVVGFKAFMCDSGLPEFPRADDLDAARRHARGGAARTAGGGARRERGDDAAARAAR